MEKKGCSSKTAVSEVRKQRERNYQSQTELGHANKNKEQRSKYSLMIHFLKKKSAESGN